MHVALLATLVGTWKCKDLDGYVGPSTFTFGAIGHGSFAQADSAIPIKYAVQGQTLIIQYGDGDNPLKEKDGFKVNGDHLLIDKELSFVKDEWTANPSIERLACIRVDARS
jgi:hypothetical protein